MIRNDVRDRFQVLRCSWKIKVDNNIHNTKLKIKKITIYVEYEENVKNEPIEDINEIDELKMKWSLRNNVKIPEACPRSFNTPGSIIMVCEIHLSCGLKFSFLPS